MISAYIALGSNLGDSRRTLRRALADIHALPHTAVTEVSPGYRSAAVGPGEPPDYINLVAAVETGFTAEALLSALQQIEHRHGRERHQRWSARTLDLDILLFGEETRDDTTLTLPHPRMRDRNFVLQPLYDLEPQLTLPCGTSLASLLQRCPPGELSPLGERFEPGHA